MWYIINLIKQLCMPMNKPGWSEYQNLSVLQRVQWLSYTSGVRFPLSQIVRGDFVEVRVMMEIPQTSRTVRQESLAIWCLNTKVREQTSQISGRRIAPNPYIAASTLRGFASEPLYVLLNRGPSFPVSALQELWCCKCDDLEAGTRCHIFHLGNI